MPTPEVRVRLRIDPSDVPAILQALNRTRDSILQLPPAQAQVASGSERMAAGFRRAAQQLQATTANAQAWYRGLHALENAQAQAAQSAARVTVSVHPIAAAMARSASGTEKFAQGLRNISASNAVVARANEGTSAGFRKVGNAVTNLGLGMVGLRGTTGKLAEGLLLMGVGGTVTLGVAAGLAVAGFAYDKLTEKTRKAREEAQKFIEEQIKAAKLRANPNAELLEGLEAAQRRAKELRAQIAQLEQQPVTLGGQFGAGKIGVGTDLPATVASLKSLREELAKTEQGIAATQGAMVERGNKLLQDLSLQVATFGMSEEGAKRLAVALDTSLTPAQRRAAQAILTTLESLRKQKEAKEKAKENHQADIEILARHVEQNKATAEEIGRLEAEERRLTAAIKAGHADRTKQLEQERELERVSKALTQARARQTDTEIARRPLSFRDHPREGFGIRNLTFGADGDQTAEFFRGFDGGAVLQNFNAQMDGVVEGMRLRVRTAEATVLGELEAFQKELQAGIKSGLGDTLASAVQGAIEGAFSGDLSIIEGFGKAVLAGLGNVFVQMGSAMIAASPIFKGLAAALTNPITSGPALAAYGTALVALGATLGAIAHGIGGGNASGGFREREDEDRIIRVQLPSTNADHASRLTPAQPKILQPIIIGPNDPTAQRGIADLWNNAYERGLVSTDGGR